MYFRNTLTTKLLKPSITTPNVKYLIIPFTLVPINIKKDSIKNDIISSYIISIPNATPLFFTHPLLEKKYTERKTFINEIKTEREKVYISFFILF
ncbi:MAG: hypothetical protein UR84_C0004G0059 [candidate division WS6 bacterium GW2011_GWD1_35_594]|nr:MAG: hypothetical protein UR49_C0004G0033 [candidate division WS6 bacterium GW2011_GWF2_33_92]KKP82388.1 MAG: hypothetical protein UR84_C0004G0059 [candidate division WS6 bacterium GW2011_GWD1_35_594]